LLAVQWRGRWRQLLASRRTLVLLALVLLVALAALAKYAVSPRPQPPDLHRYVKGLIQLVRPDYDWRTDYALNLFAAADVHFRWTVIGWARGVAALVRGELGWAEGGVAIAVALLLFWRLRSAGRLATGPWSAARLFLLGIAVFALGHAVFVIVPAMSFSPAGIANRALVAAAIGVALIFVAVMRLGVQLAPARMRSPVFAAALAAVAFLGTLRILEIEKYWTEAPAIQQKVLAAARLDLKGVPAGSSVMLDNVCPYHGSAVILEAPWDTSGALGLAIGKPLHADVVSRRMQLRPDGVATSIYGEPAFYPFGPNLYVYDPSRHLVVPLADLASAERYFRRAPRAACPEAYVGQGVLI
jgi:nitrate reductase gamma subunit